MRQRNSMRALAIMAVAATSWSATSTPAAACRCAKVYPQTHIKKHDYIARVIVTNTRQIGKWSTRQNALSTVKVLKQIKSSPTFANATSVKIKYQGRFSNGRQSSCAMQLPYKQEFWMFAKEKDGELFTSECSLAPIRGRFADQQFQELLDNMTK